MTNGTIVVNVENVNKLMVVEKEERDGSIKCLDLDTIAWGAEGGCLKNFTCDDAPSWHSTDDLMEARHDKTGPFWVKKLACDR